MLIPEHFCFGSFLGYDGPQHWVSFGTSPATADPSSLSVGEEAENQQESTDSVIIDLQGLASASGTTETDDEHNTVKDSVLLPPPYKDVPPPAYSTTSRYRALGTGSCDLSCAARKWPPWMARLTALLIWLDLICCLLLLMGLGAFQIASSAGLTHSRIGLIVVGLYGALAAAALASLARFNYVHPLWRLLVGAYCGMFVMRVVLDGLILGFAATNMGRDLDITGEVVPPPNFSSWQSALVYPVAGVCAIKDSLFAHSDGVTPSLNAPIIEGIDEIDWNYVADESIFPLSVLVSSGGQLNVSQSEAESVLNSLPNTGNATNYYSRLDLLGMQFLLIHSLFIVFILYSFVKSPYFSAPLL